MFFLKSESFLKRWNELNLIPETFFKNKLFDKHRNGVEFVFYCESVWQLSSELLSFRSKPPRSFSQREIPRQEVGVL